jgi:hypothetical protein
MFKNPAAKSAIQRITFSVNKKPASTILARLGYRTIGSVFAGKVHLANKKSKAVAIKLFHFPISDEKAQKYQQVIDDLARAGIRIPKMLMVKIPKGTPMGKGFLREDTWAQVTQLFGSVTKGSKIERAIYNAKDGNPIGPLMPPEAKRQTVSELTKIANAGYPPLEDIVEIINTRKGKEIIPIDIDYLVVHGKQDGGQRAKKLAQILLKLSNGPTTEYAELHKIAMQQATPEFRRWLIEKELKPTTH